MEIASILREDAECRMDGFEESAGHFLLSFDMKTLSSLRRPIIGDTLLHVACSSGHAHTALLLLQNGFDCVTSADGKYALHCLLERRTQSNARKRADDVDGGDDDSGYQELYMEFFRRGVDPSYSLPQRGVLDLNGGDTLLHFAVDSGSHCLIRMLLDFHVDIFARNYAGSSALENAILLDEKGKKALELLLRSLDRERLEEAGTKCLKFGNELWTYSSRHLVTHTHTHTHIHTHYSAYTQIITL
jgi:ankyrin repeat protein